MNASLLPSEPSTARQRPGVLQPSGAFRRPRDIRKRRRTGALQNAAALIVRHHFTATPAGFKQQKEVMLRIPAITAHGGGKRWGIGNLWIDLLGETNFRSETEFSRLFTPHGEVRVIPVEDSLVGRVYAAQNGSMAMPCEGG